jgi:hypothetical protein
MIDPQEFGQMQGQMQALTKQVEALSVKINEMHTQMSEAKGGWRMLMLVGGISGAAGAGLFKLGQWFMMLPK